ncbi:hypothetical protein R3W88_008079 [Solanum pinnatisectum]|uniref:Uncharacterized protein n=1 Tax=Solanum pinnatisectum TaxID=50273 RepID=A0AAV9M7U7_9SOLN|nr:hypothetical protein R3W88_008079 [Solanum pinnatisectum]
MRKSFVESMHLLDKVSKNNRAWYTRDAEVGELGDGYRNDHSGVYVPPGNRDRVGGSSSGSKLEDMMAKVLQKVESTDVGVKEMRGDFSSTSQLVDSHTTSIKNIEQQLGQLSASLNQRKNGSLPSDTKPRRTGTAWPSPLGVVKFLLTLCLQKEVKENLPLQQIPRPPPPFHQRLRKKAEDGKFTKFITMLKQLSVNIPLVEALEQMPRYAKFMNDLVTNKRAVSLDFINDVHHCSAIATRSLVQKKVDPSAFTIPYTIGLISIAKALCDLGANINLMLLAIYKKLGLGVPRPTTMRLIMADKSVKRPVRVLCDVLVKVDTFIFLDDFVILDCEVDIEVPIILGRPLFGHRKSFGGC